MPTRVTARSWRKQQRDGRADQSTDEQSQREPAGSSGAAVAGGFIRIHEINVAAANPTFNLVSLDRSFLTEPNSSP